MTKDDIDLLLADDRRPNEPAALANAGGTTGPRDIVRLDDVAKQRCREMIATLLINGADTAKIVQIMGKARSDERGRPISGLPMSEYDIKNAIKFVKAEWEEEKADEQRYAKIKARKRILNEIAEAREAKSYPAVANLERNLMMIEGTAEPTEIHIPTDNRITDAVLTLMGEMDPVRLRMLVDMERERAALEVARDAPKLPPAMVSSAQTRKNKGRGNM